MKIDKVTSIKTTARIAGFLYLFQIPLGDFGILYVPKVLMVPGNMDTTALLFGLIAQHSPLAGMFAIPVALFEFSLGIYLITKGFRPSFITTGK